MKWSSCIAAYTFNDFPFFLFCRAALQLLLLLLLVGRLVSWFACLNTYVRMRRASCWTSNSDELRRRRRRRACFGMSLGLNNSLFCTLRLSRGNHQSRSFQMETSVGTLPFAWLDRILSLFFYSTSLFAYSLLFAFHSHCFSQFSFVLFSKNIVKPRLLLLLLLLSLLSSRT